MEVSPSVFEHAARFIGRTVPCIIGGNTAPIVEAMLGTGALPFEAEPENVRFLQHYVASRSTTHPD
jgi:hypothetical protein